MSSKTCQRALVALIAVSGSLSPQLFAAPLAHGQNAHRPVPAGEVSGLELSLEGALEASPGGRMRFLVTLYEVVRARDLRPSPASEIRVVSSFRRDRPMAEVRTDALGRADVVFEVPEDQTEGFHITFDARSPRHIRRRFDIDVSLGERYALSLVPERASFTRGSPIRVLGRVTVRDGGAPAAGQDVVLETTGARTTVRTNAAGAFLATLSPFEAGPRAEITARVGTPQVTERVTVELTDPEPPELVVAVAPDPPMAAPGATVHLLVGVRTRAGAPVAAATVAIGEGEHALTASTDAAGRASLPWVVRAPSSGPDALDAPVSVRVLRVGVGSVQRTARVRIIRSTAVVSVAAEGGALVPSLAGRVWVRAVGPDGAPLPAGTAVELSSDSLATARAVTDESGVAMFRVTVPAAGAASPSDACGGATALGATLTIAAPGGRSAHEVCLPVDPDATVSVRVEPARAIAGVALRVTIERRASVARDPVVVSLLSLSGEYSIAERPVAQAIVPAAATTIDIAVPERVVGTLLVRARPLHGPGAVEVRGGGTVVQVRHAAAWSGSLARDAGGALTYTARGAGDAALEGVALAMPPQQGAELADRLRAWSGRLAVELARQDVVSDLLLEGTLAAMTPQDVSVPAVLREGRVLSLPAPEAPTDHGVLRDPWRARARFVGGRLALVLRGLEAYVATRIPDGIDDVAVRTARGWQLNRELLDAVQGSEELGAEGARGLDGAALTIVDLEALDPAFDFDHMARRITRERLFVLLVAMRKLARSRNLDLAWAWRGDPSSWLTQLLSEQDDESGEGLVERQALFDGWGHPFLLRRAAGGRARFGFLSPVPGWEIVSAGPDGRFGSPDDVFNPFARVLPSGGAYATAVGEDALLARVGGVELGRATVEALAEAFAVESSESGEGEQTAGTEAGRFVTPIARMTPPSLAFERPVAQPSAAARSYVVSSGAPTAIELPLPAEPRSWRAVSVVGNALGDTAVSTLPFESGGSLVSEVQLPARLRAGEPLVVALTVTQLGQRAARLSVEATATGDIAVSLGAEDASFSLPPGRARVIGLTFSARAPGAGEVRLLVRDERGAVVRDERQRIPVDEGGIRRRRVGAQIIRGRGELALEVPEDATSVSAQLVVTAPTALARDPAARELVRDDPALVAWSEVLAGRTLTASLRRALLDDLTGEPRSRSSRAPRTLRLACTVVALSTLPEDDVDAVVARVRAGAGLERGGDDRFGDADQAAGRTRLVAAALAALAAGASSSGSGASSSDRIASRVAALRDEARAALALHREQPGVLARAAAALLLADPRDSRGLAMLELAKAHTRAGEGGALVLVVGEDEAAREDLAGTAALAIAAQQVDDRALSAALSRSLAARAHLALRAGGEQAFWMLAAGAYGVFGADPPRRVSFERGGQTRALALVGGVGVVPLSGARAGEELALAIASEGRVLARVDATYARPTVARESGALRVTLDGDVGWVGETAGLELTLRNASAAEVDAPIAEVALPAGAVLLGSLARERPGAGDGVRAIDEPDARGLVRIHFGPLRAGEQRAVSLPIRWEARGQLIGLSVAAYDEARPTQITFLPARELVVRDRPTGPAPAR